MTAAVAGTLGEFSRSDARACGQADGQDPVTSTTPNSSKLSIGPTPGA